MAGSAKPTNITIPEDVLSQVEDVKNEFGTNNRSEVFVWLVILGLAALATAGVQSLEDEKSKRERARELAAEAIQKTTVTRRKKHKKVAMP